MSASLDIAIVGMAARVPGAADVAAFFRNLCEGVEAIERLSDEALASAGVVRALRDDPRYVRAAATLGDVALFDAAFFGYSPQEAAQLDPQHRAFLECAWECFESAGLDPERLAARVGVYAGSSFNGYIFHAMPGARGVQTADDLAALLALDKDFLATRVSYKLNLRGPSVSVQTACSTSLVAVHLACQALLSGECELALAGGVSIAVPQQVGYLYQEGGIASPDGHCRAFDARAEGTLPGSGVGIVLLKPLDDALADGDPVIAVIKGSSINNDGRAKLGFTAPSLEGQARVVREAQRIAGVDPRSIGYVEAHGTGTPLGDPIEVAALAKAFAGGEPGTCALGSVKSNLGHLDAAAGVVGLIKAALALARETIPKSLHFEAPNPQIDFARTPFYVARETHAFPLRRGVRRAGVSSFGIGGTNAHVVLEQAPARAASAAGGEGELLLLSARSDRSLRCLAEKLADTLAQADAPALADVAYTLQVGRRAFEQRAAVVVRSHADAIAQLRNLAMPSERAEARPVALLFPGQGTAYVDAAREAYDGEPLFRAQIDASAALLAPMLGVDLRALLFRDFPCALEEQTLERMRAETRYVQPALFALGLALGRMWCAQGIALRGMLGHSVGEYVAACLSGTLSSDDAHALVATRGRLMQELPQGAMTAVAASEREIHDLLGPEVALAAVNGPAQCVLAGTCAAIDQVERELTRRGLRSRRLEVERAFHSHLMAGALAPFRAALERVSLQPPRAPWVSNLTGTWIAPHEACDPGYWVRHLRETVRFGEGVATLCSEPTEPILLALGPGAQLTALVQQVRPSARTLSGVPSAREGRLAILGRLWSHGAAVDFGEARGLASGRRVALPSTPFEQQRYWLEAPSFQAVALAPAKVEQPTLYVPSWKRAARRPAATLSGRWLVLGDDVPLLSALMARLEQGGAELIRVRHAPVRERGGERAFTLRGERAEDCEWLVGELERLSLSPSHVVHAAALSRVDALEGGEALDHALDHALGQGLESVLWLARAFARLPAPPRLTVLAAEVLEVTGEERLFPAYATLAGAVRSLRLEYPALSCQLLDVELGSRAAPSRLQLDTLLGELAAVEPDAVVALRGMQRFLPTLERATVEPAATPLRKRGTYLITGGLGGIGLALAEQLGASGARLVLTARSRPGERERARIAALEAAGVELLVLQADVASRADMTAALQATRARFGALHGVVHAAGAADTGLVDALSREALRGELAPKVMGALVLSELLCDEPLDFVVYLSSLTAQSGGLGQAAYAAANAFLDAHAAARCQQGARVLSLALDRVRDAGMAARAEARLAGFGIALPSLPGLALDQLGALLASALAVASTSHVLLAASELDGLPRDELGLLLREHLSSPQAHDPTAQGGEPALDLEATSVRMRALWARAFGLPDVDPTRDFYALGGESLLALQILNRVRETFAVELPLRELFEHRTVESLARRVHALRTATGAAAAAASDEPALVALPRRARRPVGRGEGEP